MAIRSGAARWLGRSATRPPEERHDLLRGSPQAGFKSPRRAAEQCDWTPAGLRTGAGNAWAPLSADTALGLVYVPTGSAAPDFFGGERPGDNRYTNSVVALDGKTGKVRWHFQVVHHDLWDFDVGSQPSLITVPRDGREVPAVAVVTKMGHIFILDRATGEPLFPVEERPVPASDVPGERASPTQPFPVLPKPLFEPQLQRADIWGLTGKEKTPASRSTIACGPGRSSLRPACKAP